MDPKSVGVPQSKLVLGKHSGRHALNQRALDLGFNLSKEELGIVYARFTEAADRKKGLRNDEILHLIQEVAGQTVSAAASV